MVATHILVLGYPRTRLHSSLQRLTPKYSIKVLPPPKMARFQNPTKGLFSNLAAIDATAKLLI